MRILEGSLIGALCLKPLSLFTVGYHSLIQPATQFYAIGAFTAVQLLVEGYRWQLTPTYLAALLQIIPSEKLSTTWKIVLSLSQIALLGLSAILCILLPVFRIRKPTGPFSVGTFTTEFFDQERNAWDLYRNQVVTGPRRLQVRLWYPITNELANDPKKTSVTEYLPHYDIKGGLLAREVNMPSFIVGHFAHIRAHSRRNKSNSGADPLPFAQEAQKCPVVIFSHGYCSSADLSVVLAENLASYGVLVVAVEHTYDAVVTYFESTKEVAHFNASPPKDLPSRDAFWEFRARHLEIRTDDVIFVTKVIQDIAASTPGKGKDDRCIHDLSQLLQGRLNLHRIAVMGHSFGACTAINACARDPKLFRGAFGLDAWVTPISPDIKKSGVSVPVMLIQASQFYDNAFWSQTNKEDSEGIVRRSPQSTIYYVDDAKHQDFIDLPLYAPLFSQCMKITGPHGYDLQEVLCRYSLKFLKQMDMIDPSHVLPQMSRREKVPIRMGTTTEF